MVDIWVIADHHFNHANFLTFRDKHGSLIRPEFENVQEMNEYMVTMHNEVVKPTDICYFLGDVVWKSSGEMKQLIWSLQGRRRLCIGNHDDYTFLAPMFERVYLWKKLKEYPEVILSHVPIHKEDMVRIPYNVHGHIHERSVLLPDGTQDPQYMCVSVEQIGYQPMHMDDVMAFLKDYKESVE